MAIAIRSTSLSVSRDTLLMGHLHNRFGPKRALNTGQFGGSSSLHVKPHHHSVVFMDHVVTVNGVFAKEVPRSQKDVNHLVGPEDQHVLLALFSSVGRLPVPQKDAKFLKLKMNRVRPGVTAG